MSAAKDGRRADPVPGASSIPDVLGVGESMVLLTPGGGETLEAAKVCSVSFAGAESTVALYLADEGHPVGWVGRVGQDPFGRRILSGLRKNRVDTSLVETDQRNPTGVFFKDPEPDGTRVHYYRKGSAAAHMGPDLADRLPIEGTRILHLSGITGALSSSCRRLVEVLFERARAAAVEVSFDVNYRPGLWATAEAAAPLAALARLADVVFVGRDEAQTLWGTDSAESVA